MSKFLNTFRFVFFQITLDEEEKEPPPEWTHEVDFLAQLDVFLPFLQPLTKYTPIIFKTFLFCSFLFYYYYLVIPPSKSQSFIFSLAIKSSGWPIDLCTIKSKEEKRKIWNRERTFFCFLFLLFKLFFKNYLISTFQRSAYRSNRAILFRSIVL